MDYNAKHQQLIPHNSYVTDLLIKKMHEVAIHGGPMLTESFIRQQYWIIGGYRRIKKIIHECMICRRYSNKKMQQFMGNLPRDRVTGIRAFINCGVDYAGPISVRTTKGRGHKSIKGYIAVFICLATKAIHLECASDMTAEAFLAAFRRFTARRGNVTNMYSDNGSNFVKANLLLQCKGRQEEEEYSNTVFTELARVGTKWHFNPPASPNFGGLWEAGVKSVKTHMKKSIGDSTLTFEELSTLLYQIEATLNSRPLCALSADVNDTAILTPGHFLIGEAICTPPESNFLDINTNRLTRWQLIQKMHQSFWKKWSTEYLNRLQERPKWLKRIDEPEINDLVLMKEDNLPPARWATGRIIAKHPGKDGLTRVVEIKINDKIYKRPLSKVCSLPTNNEHNSTAMQDESIQQISSHPAFVQVNKRKSTLIKYRTTQFVKKQKKGFVKRDIPRSNGLAIAAMIMAYIVSMNQPASASTGVQMSPFKYHPGIYFENRGTAYLSNTKWNILAYYDMTHYLEELQGIRKSIKTMKTICAGISGNFTECGYNIVQLEEHYSEIDKKNRIINHDGSNRRKRATLNFVGNILGDIFGVLDSNFAEEYARDLGKINKNEEHLLLLMRNHTTVAETTLNIIRKDENVIAVQTKRINDIIDDIQNMSSDQEKVNSLTSATFRILIALTKYEATQSSILDVLLDVHNKQANANILPPEQLKIQLNRIHANIDASILVPGEDAHDELRSLYSIMSIQATTAHGQIIFRITLPLVLNEQFQIFNLIATPTLQGLNYIWFEPSTPYLLTTLRRNYYYALNEFEFKECNEFGKQSIICERKHQMHGAHTTRLGCEVQLLNHDHHLTGNCTFKTTSIEDIWIPLHESNKWIYVIYNNNQMDVICNDKIEHITIHGEGIIQLQPHCTIRHSTIEITAQNNYDAAIHGSILPEINITMEIDKYRQTRDPHFVTFDKSNTSTLDEMIHTLKMEEKHLPENLTTHDVHHYGLGYSLVFVIILYLFFRFIRYRKRRQRHIPIEMIPIAAPRTISMPDLGGRENV